jgi:L-ribulose-5-phosphate 3-epimerase
MNNLLGVMQGRLLPKYKGRYQAHPVGYWQDEFPIASELGLDCIEFILDYNDFEKNPLSSSSGIKSIQKSIAEANIKVVSFCADYFMEAPFHTNEVSIADENEKVLKMLLENGKELGIKDIVIPCVDQSSLKSDLDKEKFMERITPLAKEAEKLLINLSLETDLPPQEFHNLVKTLNLPAIKVNYDIGNSASLGYSPQEELQYYGNYISDIHIKDRKLGSGSVELGIGDADFETVIGQIKNLNYRGPFIMQAYRDDEGLTIFKRQLEWVRIKFGEFLN